MNSVPILIEKIVNIGTKLTIIKKNKTVIFVFKSKSYSSGFVFY